MIQQSLFDLQKVSKPNPKERCKNCVHIYQHEYNKTKYCKAKKQKGTSYGHKKIKANDSACPLFEPIKKES